MDVMPSSHTPPGPWRKISSKERDLGAQIAPRLTRKLSDICGFFLSGRVSVVFPCGGHKYVGEMHIDLGC